MPPVFCMLTYLLGHVLQKHLSAGLWQLIAQPTQDQLVRIRHQTSACRRCWHAAEDFASVGGDSPTSSVASSGASAYNSAASLPGSAVLPRADVLILGGDLAYPNPSNMTYEKRLFRCR